MKEELKKFFRKFEDLLVYLSGSMLAIFLEVLSVQVYDYNGNMATLAIISTVNTVLIFSLIGFFIKKGGD